MIRKQSGACDWTSPALLDFLTEPNDHYDDVVIQNYGTNDCARTAAVLSRKEDDGTTPHLTPTTPFPSGPRPTINKSPGTWENCTQDAADVGAKDGVADGHRYGSRGVNCATFAGRDLKILAGPHRDALRAAGTAALGKAVARDAGYKHAPRKLVDAPVGNKDGCTGLTVQ